MLNLRYGRHRKTITFIIALAIIAGGVLYIHHRNTPKVIESYKSPQLNGDYLYKPPASELKWDEKEHIAFYQNILYVSLTHEITDRQKKGIAKAVDGRIVGDMSGGINILQILVRGDSIGKLNKLGAKLQENRRYGNLINQVSHYAPAYADDSGDKF